MCDRLSLRDGRFCVSRYRLDCFFVDNTLFSALLRHTLSTKICIHICGRIFDEKIFNNGDDAPNCWDTWSVW